jgi:hypothetical protein
MLAELEGKIGVRGYWYIWVVVWRVSDIKAG